jgi:hypothetical protein
MRHAEDWLALGLSGTSDLQMNRFAAANRLFSQILGWLFLATLLSDAVNLDDLVCGHPVLHDMDDVVLINLGMFDGADAPMCRAKRCPREASGIRQSALLSPASVRIIIDQDSPSIGAPPSQTISDSLPVPEDSPAVSFKDRLSVDLLHLRHCTLLV